MRRNRVAGAAPEPPHRRFGRRIIHPSVHFTDEAESKIRLTQAFEL